MATVGQAYLDDTRNRLAAAGVSQALIDKSIANIVARNPGTVDSGVSDSVGLGLGDFTAPTGTNRAEAKLAANQRIRARVNAKEFTSVTDVIIALAIEYQRALGLSASDARRIATEGVQTAFPPGELEAGLIAARQSGVVSTGGTGGLSVGSTGGFMASPLGDDGGTVSLGLEDFLLGGQGALAQAEIDSALALLGDSAGAIEGENPNEAAVWAALEAEAGGDMATTEELAEGPFTRYLKYRGVGQAPGQIPFASRAGRYIQSQYGRAQQLRDVQFPLYSDLGLATRSPYEYATQFATTGARRQRGRDVLSTFYNMTPEQRQNLGYTFEPYYDEDEVGRYEGRNLGILQGLIQQGRRHLGGSTAGDYLASRVPYMLDQWEALQPSVGGTVTPFVDYLKSKFGL